MALDFYATDTKSTGCVGEPLEISVEAHFTIEKVIEPTHDFPLLRRLAGDYYSSTEWNVQEIADLISEVKKFRLLLAHSGYSNEQEVQAFFNDFQVLLTTAESKKQGVCTLPD